MKYKTNKKNKERAMTTAYFIGRFQAMQNMKDEPDEDIVTDFTVNLLHYMAQKKLNPREIIERAFSHFDAEAGGES